MLKAAHRMVNPAEFAAATRGGRRKGTPRLVVHVQTGGGTSGPLVGFVVPKRALKHAVDRNLVKRRLRHIMRDLTSQLPADSLIVIRAMTPALTASYRQLENDIKRCLDKLLPALHDQAEAVAKSAVEQAG